MRLSDYLDTCQQPDFQVAAELGITPAHLSRLRNGQGGCSLALAVRIQRWSGGLVMPADLLPPASGRAA